MSKKFRLLFPARWSDTRTFLYYLVPIFNAGLIVSALILGLVFFVCGLR